MRSPGQSFGIAFALMFTLVVGLVLGVFLDRTVVARWLPGSTIPAEARADFDLMAEAWNIIHTIYVDRTALEGKNVTYGAIQGMVQALGDTGHSRFQPPEVKEQEDRALEGEFEGIGASIEMRDNQFTIVAPFDGSPAQQAGLRPGDVILAVDGADLNGLTLTEGVEKILGPAGTQVTLTILDRETGQTRDVTITRAKIQVSNVTWTFVPGTQIAMIRITQFADRVGEDLNRYLREAQDQGATGVILDLRNNPGGLLDEAVVVTSQFLREGDVLRVRDAQQNEEALPVEGEGAGYDIPVVVLINQGSASASEIVAGALQDYDRATLVGETTFGTGTVLNQFDLADGSALLLATQEWLTPKGRQIWHQGIPPDEQVALPDDVSPLVPEAMDGLSAAEVVEHNDTQLLRALELFGAQ